MPNNAYVTLFMKNNDIIQFAVLAQSIRNTNTKYKIVCMVTNDVDNNTQQELKKYFD
jgi:hypothetical protein